MPTVMLKKYFPTRNPPSGGCWDDEVRRAWRPRPIEDLQLISRRNQMILGMAAQTMSAFVGVVLTRYRKSMASNMFNFMLLITAAVGFYGSLNLKYYVMLAHSGLTVGFTVVFFAYMLLEMFLTTEQSSAMVWILMHFMFVWQVVFVYIGYRLWNYIRHKHRYPERVPFTENAADYDPNDFAAANELPEVKQNTTANSKALAFDADVNERKTSVGGSFQELQEDKKVTSNWDFADQNNDVNVKIDNDDLCCICLSKKRTVAMVPCGHKCLCSDVKCNGGIIGKPCPICRQKVTSKMRIFD